MYFVIRGGVRTVVGLVFQLTEQRLVLGVSIGIKYEVCRWREWVLMEECFYTIGQHWRNKLVPYGDCTTIH